MSDENKTDSQTTNDPAVASSDLLGAMYRGSDGAMTCALCHYEMEWEECSACGGDGGFDGYEEDPLWYQPGELAPCPQCNSGGGDWWCANKDCPTQSGWKVIPAPKAPNAPGERPPTDGARTRPEA